MHIVIFESCTDINLSMNLEINPGLNFDYVIATGNESGGINGILKEVIENHRSKLESISIVPKGILLPNDWLAKLWEAMLKFQKPGVVAIKTSETGLELSSFLLKDQDGFDFAYDIGHHLYGVFMIHPMVLKEIGGFDMECARTASDYVLRCRQSGRRPLFIQNATCRVLEPTDEMKEEALLFNWAHHQQKRINNPLVKIDL